MAINPRIPIDPGAKIPKALLHHGLGGRKASPSFGCLYIYIYTYMTYIYIYVYREIILCKKYILCINVCVHQYDFTWYNYVNMLRINMILHDPHNYAIPILSSITTQSLFMVSTPRGRRGVLSFFHVCVTVEASMSFHVLHCFLVRRCIFRAFCCVGGLITFLFINVPASSFLTRFSLLQVTVWHAFDVFVLICWRWW